MAGDWIPMRVDLARDPAVISMAQTLGVDEDYVVGKLHRLWGWASEQIVCDPDGTGNAVGVTPACIDRYCTFPGFADALIGVYWLKEFGGGIAIPQFDRWMSQGGKQRLLNAKRQRKFKQRNGNTARVTKSLLQDNTVKDSIVNKYSFETTSGGWVLSEGKRLEYEQAFGGNLDVCGELSCAAQWLLDNPTKRKTPQGMTRFLTGWLKRGLRKQSTVIANSNGQARPTVEDLLTRSKSEHPELWRDDQ